MLICADDDEIAAADPSKRNSHAILNLFGRYDIIKASADPEQQTLCGFVDPDQGIVGFIRKLFEAHTRYANQEQHKNTVPPISSESTWKWIPLCHDSKVWDSWGYEASAPDPLGESLKYVSALDPFEDYRYIATSLSIDSTNEKKKAVFRYPAVAEADQYRTIPFTLTSETELSAIFEEILDEEAIKAEQEEKKMGQENGNSSSKKRKRDDQAVDNFVADFPPVADDHQAEEEEDIEDDIQPPAPKIAKLASESSLSSNNNDDNLPATQPIEPVM